MSTHNLNRSDPDTPQHLWHSIDFITHQEEATRRARIQEGMQRAAGHTAVRGIPLQLPRSEATDTAGGDTTEYQRAYLTALSGGDPSIAEWSPADVKAMFAYFIDPPLNSPQKTE